MAAPSSAPKREFVPHPDDLDDAREAVEAGELSPEESAAYLRALLGDDSAPTE